MIIVFGNIEVNAWWEWFVTTILGVGTTGFIAVANRSHNIYTLNGVLVPKKNPYLINLAAARPTALLTPET